MSRSVTKKDLEAELVCMMWRLDTAVTGRVEAERMLKSRRAEVDEAMQNVKRVERALDALDGAAPVQCGNEWSDE